MYIKSANKNNGFTIVELLVVIVVIGILASLTIVSFTGVSQKASVATISSDLKNASTQIEVDKVYNGTYPLTDSSVNGGNGLSKSDGTIYSYQLYEDGYCIQATSATVTSPYRYYSIVGSVESGACPKVWNKISLTANHACGIASDNQAYCWGSNSFGQVGNGNTTNALSPTAVDTSGVLSGKNLVDIVAGWGHTCALDADYVMYCWGYNAYGQLGDNSTTNSSSPLLVNVATVLGGRTVKAISAGYAHTCIVASDDNAYCWGWNNTGELGNGNNTASSIAVAVSKAGVFSDKTIKQLISVGETNCAIASDDNAYCWGDNSSGAGQLGNNSTSNSNVPVAVSKAGVLSGKTVKSISIGQGGTTTCAIASDDNAYCWGNSMNGELGNNSLSYSSIPVAVSTSGVLSGKTVQKIAAGSCAVASDSLAYCWGSNSAGKLGNNSTTRSLVPVAVNTSGVLSGKNMIDIKVGNGYSCGLSSTKKAYCWGGNGSGNLGDGSTTQSLVPVLVSDIP